MDAIRNDYTSRMCHGMVLSRSGYDGSMFRFGFRSGVSIHGARVLGTVFLGTINCP